MPYIRTPVGITPPAPGLDHEEPEFVPSEDDIPMADSGSGSRSERTPGRDERARHKPERE